jgi:hypothetical protein
VIVFPLCAPRPCTREEEKIEEEEEEEEESSLLLFMHARYIYFRI